MNAKNRKNSYIRNILRASLRVLSLSRSLIRKIMDMGGSNGIYL